jgi:uncharacterized membrane protein YGL010W
VSNSKIFNSFDRTPKPQKMKTLEQWFEEYAVSHQNPKNKAIHYVCVPAIYFSITGLLMSIPSDLIANTLQIRTPIIENWAVVVLLFVQVFYIRLSVAMALKIALFSAICLIVNFYISQFVPLWLFSIAVFVIAWIGQFYGHNIEGKKPSFLKDLQFLLIGPAWVVENLFSGKQHS